jgi:DNA-binding transcriptional regulator of glucitol operon
VRRVFTPKWCLAHLVLVAAVLAMLRLGLWQWDRAESKTGGIQNYAYAMQWPLFAVFAIVVYVKTLIEETRHDLSSPRHSPRQRALPPEQAGVMRRPGVRVGVQTGPIEIDDDDEETLEWNARLAALNAASAASDARAAHSRATRRSPGS